MPDYADPSTWHPASNIFPLLGSQHLSELSSDIKIKGLLNPVILYQGKLLDGRNRAIACKMVGVPLASIEWQGRDLSAVDWIISQNLKRRHLSKSEAAACAVEALPFLEAEARKRERAGKDPSGYGGGRGKKKNPRAQLPEGLGRARTHVAKAFHISGRYVADAKAIKQKAPTVFEQIKSGEKTIPQAKRELKQTERKAKHAEAVKAVASLDISKVADLRVCSMLALLPALGDIDAIITDPPYGRNAVPLYEELAKLAKQCLAPHGILAVMCGQSYLPQILSAMAIHIDYRWIMAYLSEGPASKLWARTIRSMWKPILLFGASGDWMTDVVKSDFHDERFHEWGQSESGMARLVEKITRPGWLVCDPFLGAGTTAVVSVALGRRFVGCDLEAENIRIATERIQLLESVR